jgi:hypothetical protein
MISIVIAAANAGLAATRRDYFVFTGSDFLESSIFERRSCPDRFE